MGGAFSFRLYRGIRCQLSEKKMARGSKNSLSSCHARQHKKAYILANRLKLELPRANSAKSHHPFLGGAFFVRGSARSSAFVLGRSAVRIRHAGVSSSLVSDKCAYIRHRRNSAISMHHPFLGGAFSFRPYRGIRCQLFEKKDGARFEKQPVVLPRKTTQESLHLG